MQEHSSIRRPWPSTQQFTLSSHGRTVAAAYRAEIAAASGRGSFDAACTAWATRFELLPADGAYLTEIRSSPSTLRQLGEALAICSQSREDVRVSVTRLVEVGLVVTVSRH
jgi:hypothetical protein